ncbi:MAG TPA: hypothetical protein VN667_21210, partial [Burkholderiales bacterium]|nr:hypothetical protein [Burkholderiales bacterium]
SQQALEHWQQYREGDEGLHAWLCRVAMEALKAGTRRGDKVDYIGMRFVFALDGVWPVLKTVIRSKRSH